MPLSEFRPHLHTPCEREIRPCVAFSTLTNPHLRRPPRRKGDTRLKPTGHQTNAYAMRRETYLPLTVRRLRFHSRSRPARCPFPSASFKELASTTFFKVSWRPLSRGPRDLPPTIRFERAIIFLALPNGKRSAETNESGVRLFELFKRSRVSIAIDYAATDTTGLSPRFSFSLDRVRPRRSNVTC